jgi:3-phenylpropionate/trans-cinnamate dioxygenase ferredoxin component
MDDARLCAGAWEDYAGHMTTPDFAPALPLADLPEGGAKCVGGILFCHDEGQVYAVENKCSHLEEPLEGGRVKWGWIACPAHGARFDLATGDAMNPPATAPIRTYPVRVVDGMIEVAA